MCYKNGEWFELPPEKVEDLIEIMENKNKVPPLDNIVYYSPGTRVLWNGEPGVVHSLHLKSYPYEVGYNIVLDSQKRKNEPEIGNSGYSELVLEESRVRSTEGYYIDPRDETKM